MCLCLQGPVDELQTFERHALGRSMLLPLHVRMLWSCGSSLQDQLHTS